MASLFVCKKAFYSERPGNEYTIRRTALRERFQPAMRLFKQSVYRLLLRNRYCTWRRDDPIDYATSYFQQSGTNNALHNENWHYLFLLTRFAIPANIRVDLPPITQKSTPSCAAGDHTLLHHRLVIKGKI
jgi:hypothetical protein